MGLERSERCCFYGDGGTTNNIFLVFVSADMFANEPFEPGAPINTAASSRNGGKVHGVPRTTCSGIKVRVSHGVVVSSPEAIASVSTQQSMKALRASHRLAVQSGWFRNRPAQVTRSGEGSRSVCAEPVKPTRHGLCGFPAEPEPTGDDITGAAVCREPG